MIPDLVPISEIRNYIVQLTGVFISKGMIRKLTRNGDIPVLILPTDRRRRFTRKFYIYEFVKRYAEPKPEPTFEEILDKLHKEMKEMGREDETLFHR